MTGIRFSEDFKKDAVSQVTDRGYSVREVAERLGISTKSLYTWKAQLSKPGKVIDNEAVLASELRRVKRELARVTEERDILKKATVHSIGHRNISLNIAAGVLNPSVFLGLVFNLSATLFSSLWLWIERSVFLGKYWRKSLFVFSLVPRCHGL